MPLYLCDSKIISSFKVLSEEEELSRLVDLKGEHLFYCCGAKVRIRNGQVKVLTEPNVVHCPLHASLYGTTTIDKAAVKRSIEEKIRNGGFCCKNRRFDDSLVVPYGASEIIAVCMQKGLFDCAVTVCDGAGTIITSNYKLVQAIGARLTGIMKTSPIASTISYIKSEGGQVLDEHTTKIDQTEGVLKAAELGFQRVAVTVASFDSTHMKSIRKVESKKALEVTVFSVCNTCADEESVRRIKAASDIVCASASKLVRERIGPKARLQLGVAIPVFALTQRGKDILLSYLLELDYALVAFRTKKLPYLVEGREPKLRNDDQ